MSGASAWSARWRSMLPGVVVSVAIAAGAWAMTRLPIPPFQIEDDAGVRSPIGPAIVAIVLGVVIGNVVRFPPAVAVGTSWIVKRWIPVAIVLTGAGLNLTILVEIGPAAMLVVLAAVASALAAAMLAARLLGVRSTGGVLLGAGTAICGTSAIIAVAPLTDADDEEVALSIGVVNLFGLLAMLALPATAIALNLSDEAFGVWAGATIHAVPQAVGAGFGYTVEAGELTTLVKLVRVAMLAPFVFILAAVLARRGRGAGAATRRPRFWSLVPWFVWGFALLACVHTVWLMAAGGAADGGGIISAAFEGGARAGTVLLIIAMAAIGLEVKMARLVRVGGPMLLAGLIATIALVMVTAGLIALLFRPSAATV